MSLGKKLKKTLDELEKADIKKLSDQASADMEKVRRERRLDEEFLISKKKEIVNAVESGKVPLVKICESDRKSWLQKVKRGEGRNSDLWFDFVQYFRSEGLDIVLKENNHENGYSWIEMTAKVLPDRPRSRMPQRDVPAERIL